MPWAGHGGVSPTGGVPMGFRERWERAAAYNAARSAWLHARPVEPRKPEKPKPVIVKTYSGFFANSEFEREAARLTEQGYAVQAVAAKGQQVSGIDTLSAGVFGLGSSRSKVKAKDGGIVVTYALTDQRRTYLAAQADRYPADLAAYRAALSVWKASEPKHQRDG